MRRISLPLAWRSKPAQTSLAFRDPRIFSLALVLFAILGATYGLLLWLPQIVQAMGFLNREVGFITALPAAAAAAAMVWWGRASDLSGERVWHLSLAMLFGAAGFTVAAVSHSNLTQLLALSAAFIGLFCSLPIVHNIPATFLRGGAAAPKEPETRDDRTNPRAGFSFVYDALYRPYEVVTDAGSQGKLVRERSRPGSARRAFHAAQAASTTAS